MCRLIDGAAKADRVAPGMFFSKITKKQNMALFSGSDRLLEDAPWDVFLSPTVDMVRGKMKQAINHCHISCFK